MEKILVVDNEKSMRDLLAIMLQKEGYFIDTADDGDTALAILAKDNFDLIITDIKMPRMNGVTLLHEAKAVSPETIVIMMTAYASTETAVEAMKEGAYDYLTKPFRLEEVSLIIQNALERKRLQRENLHLKQELKGRFAFTQILGKSQKMQKVLELVQKVADQRANILILGESGTGKELIARAIHFNSARKDYPFVAVNCGALPEPLLESELFGHMKGSFTGAISNKEGLFEVAHEGSILLDEIGDTPLSIQVKLLRVLQEKEFRRVGGTKDIRVDVRIIAATNQDLGKLVSAGKFREDLYYRLNVIPILIPPLRDHAEDIPILTDAFIKRFNLALGKQITGIEHSAMQALMRHEWKGNVRELENCLERAVALSTQKILTATDVGFVVGAVREPPLTKAGNLSLTSPSIPESGLDLEVSIETLEKGLILTALKETNGVQTEAAKRLHVSVRSLRWRLQKYGIDPTRTCKD
ncbi:MAG: sigma-54-dependent Fis family transcriptional regulator [Nitrospirae bacterium]|nr:sigma-54-dependent Fis family transcriptional regulator [Candidatus Troglogloeales bacterium]MBI3598858.1 sigma-54-dependent Fis family transcriptional regulator [Candidatus Troglogloeales bacterium]